METYMVVDIDRCWGCKACQVACKQEHGTPVGEGAIEAVKVERQLEQLSCDYVPVFCQHCDHPSCAEVCPTNAIIRDEEGLVQIDAKACISCGACVDACPYGAAYLRQGEICTAEKCDMCVNRRKRGFLTACEQHCLGQVFTSCGEEYANELVKDRFHWRVGKVIYMTRKISSIGQGVE